MHGNGLVRRAEWRDIDRAARSGMLYGPGERSFHDSATHGGSWGHYLAVAAKARRDLRTGSDAYTARYVWGWAMERCRVERGV